MTIFFCCDDNYFTDGAISLLESNEIIAEPIDNKNGEKVISCNDVIILETTSEITLRNLAIQATLAGATFLLVLDTYCHIKSPAAWTHNHFSKKINKDLLVKLMRYITVQCNDIEEDLTLCELETMKLLLNGKKPDVISLELCIPLKSVFEYKKNALLKMGLRNDNSLHLIHFKNLTLLRYYRLKKISERQ